MGGFDAFSVDLDALQDAARGISDAVAETVNGSDPRIKEFVQ